jgi:hypothetical protein
LGNYITPSNTVTGNAQTISNQYSIWFLGAITLGLILFILLLVFVIKIWRAQTAIMMIQKDVQKILNHQKNRNNTKNDIIEP